MICLLKLTILLELGNIFHGVGATRRVASTGLLKRNPFRKHPKQDH